MRFVSLLILFLVYYLQDITCKKQKYAKPWTQKSPDSKYDNPGQIRDRERHLESKAYKNLKGLHRPSLMGFDWHHRYQKPFHPAWMDYCDPYHCNDYHKVACGLNRDTMRFKWFQSGCHIALNNICSRYKGTLKYDMIEAKWCTTYVLHLRSNCPQECSDDLDPVCGVSSYDNHVVVFKNACYLEQANCYYTRTFNEYIVSHMDICNKTYKLLEKTE